MKTILGFLTITFTWICILALFSLPLKFIITYFIYVTYVQTFLALLGIFLIKIALNPTTFVSHLTTSVLDKYIDKSKSIKKG